MKTAVHGSILALAAALLLAGCGITTYDEQLFEAYLQSAEPGTEINTDTGELEQALSQLSYTIVLNVDEEGQPTGSFGIVVDSAQLVVQPLAGSPEAVVESVELEYYYRDGTRIEPASTEEGDEGEPEALRPYRVALGTYLPAGFQCPAGEDDEGVGGDCRGDVQREPYVGPPVYSPPFLGVPFGVAEAAYTSGASTDRMFARVNVNVRYGENVLELSTEPVSLVQEVQLGE